MMTLRRPPRRGFGEQPATLAAIQNLFARGELGGYWPADPQYAYEDSAGTTLASVNGVVGLRYDRSSGTVAAARRNLLTYTEDLSNAVWTNVNTSVTPNAIEAPDGTITAIKLTVNDAVSRLTQNITVPVSGYYVHNVCCKLGVGTYCGVTLYNNTTATALANSDINLTNGNVVNYTGSASAIHIGNGWYNVYIASAISVTAGNSIRFYIYPCSDSVDLVGKYHYFWHPQCELGASPTTYQKITTGLGDWNPGNHAFQQTTANKPYLRRTPTTNKYWYDSDISTGAMTVTFSGSLGSSCTIASATPEGVSILENQTVGSTYNICPSYGYNSDALIINRALTAAEKALVTRVMQRSVPTLGSNLVVNGLFAADTDWTKGTGWSINSGVATKSAGTASNLTETLGASGNQYRVTADITLIAGTIGAYNGTAQIGATAVTTASEKYTMKTTSTTIGFRGDASFAGTVDNAVIQEIL